MLLRFQMSTAASHDDVSPSSAGSSRRLSRKLPRHLRCLLTLLALMATVDIFLLESQLIHNDIAQDRADADAPSVPERQTANATGVAFCTPEQLSIIRRQLPPDDCLKHRGHPWQQRCSLVYATRCPDSMWLERHYARAHFAAAAPRTPFLGIFVGCNKGLDAVNAMRMGTGNPAFDKATWMGAMTRGGKTKLGRDVCNQATKPQFALPVGTGVDDRSLGSRSQLHCIEPAPSTFRALRRAAWETKYERMGLVMTNAALSGEVGSARFARGDDVGDEGKRIGGGACNGSGGRHGVACSKVDVYSLDAYVEKFVTGNATINYLSIDAEGHDYEILMGGEGKTLARVQYLEFEYNWVGIWKNRSLHHIIERLHQRFGFTCYWAGFNGTIWRITNCWLDHYAIHFWSNVACVNRNFNEVRDIAEEMEGLFFETLLRNDAVRDFEHRFQRKDD